MRYNGMMYTIVGLGNPGAEYSETRHNVGWIVLEQCRRAFTFPDFVDSRAYSGQISEGVIQESEVRILFPHTFMNKSGSAVKKAVTTKADCANLMVVYDDVDLPFGTVKVSVGRGAGGHNGVQSIIDALGTKDFVRIRIGIARKNFWGRTVRPRGESLTRHVLGRFTKREIVALEKTAEKVEVAIRLMLREGPEAAMQAINRDG